MSLQQRELLALQMERDRLQDEATAGTTPDELLEQTRRERDDALAK